MILEITCIIAVVVIVAFIIDKKSCYKKKKEVSMSFKEAMDLVDLPVVTFYNNGKKFNFLLDTGASLSVIDSNVLSSFEHTKLSTKGTVFGMEGNNIDVSHITASLEYKDKYYSENFQVIDMSKAFNQLKMESGVTLSGILGSLFFKKYQYVLDFNKLIAYSNK